MNTVKQYIKITRFSKKYWRRQLIVVAAACIFTILGLLNPLFLKYFIDDGLLKKDLNISLILVFVFFTVILLRHFFDIAANILYAKLGSIFTYDLRKALFEHILKWDYLTFKKKKTSDLFARVNDDIQSIEHFITDSGVQIFTNFLTLFIALAIIIFFSYYLALITFVLLVFLPISFTVVRPRVKEAATAQRELNSDLIGIIQSWLQNFPIIKFFDSKEVALKQYENVGKKLVITNIRLQIIRLVAGFSAEVVGNVISPLAVLGIGCYFVIKGNITIGTLIAINTYSLMLIGPMVYIFRVNVTLQQVMASVERILSVFDIKQSIKEPVRPNVLSLSIEGFGIELKNVSFDYGEGPVLNNLSFNIYAGEKIALLGRTGEGKSTIAYLITRLFDPSDGQVIINGEDIRTYSLSSLTERVSLVPQDALIFHASIKDNITLFNDGYNEDKLEKIIIMVQLKELYDSLTRSGRLLGDSGVLVSGGEKQRIALARGILRKPAVLILDEATSGVDLETESAIKDALFGFLPNATILFITHRIPSVTSYDRIFVLHEGKITETGSHTELLRNNGYYAKLWEEQITNKKVKRI